MMAANKVIIWIQDCCFVMDMIGNYGGISDYNSDNRGYANSGAAK